MERSPELVHWITKAIRHLPEPVGSYRTSGVEFDVYRAKDLHVATWNNEGLKQLVLACRSSYRRYGDRPLLDPHDKKAAIYLVRARYRRKMNAGFVEEWLSIRMVPGDKQPFGLHEPEVYVRGGKSIDHWMKKKIGATGFWHQVASSSRMCGIHPYRILGNDKIVFLNDVGHRTTPICFALIHKQFLLDYPMRRFPYRYITAAIRPDYHRKGLSYRVRSQELRPVFTPAYKFLGVPQGEVSVKRGVYSYQFPLYWFDAKKLLWLINSLRKKEHKSPLIALKPEMFVNMAKTDHRPVSIAGLRMDPAIMRQLMDTHLPDAPELKITTAKVWYSALDKMLKAANVVAKE